MDNKESTDHPLVDIVKTLRSIPDRDKPCDREATTDGTEILLYRQIDDIKNRKIWKNKKKRKNQKGRKKR